MQQVQSVMTTCLTMTCFSELRSVVPGTSRETLRLIIVLRISSGELSTCVLHVKSVERS